MFAVVVGAGRIGFHIAKYLYERGDKVAVIDMDARLCDELSTIIEAMIFDGDGSDLHTYQNLEMTLVDTLFAVTDDDEVNIAVCKMGNIQWGIPYIIARVNDPKLKGDFRQAGADVAICPAEEAFPSFENTIEKQQLITILARADIGFKITSVKIPPNGIVVGKTIKNLRIHHDLSINLPIPKMYIIPVVLRRNGMIFPDDNTFFEAEDQVFIIGSVSEVDPIANQLRRID